MGVKPKILGVGGGVGIRGGFKGSLDATDDDSHSASSGSRATMMLAMISMLKPVRTLKRPAITLPVAKSVNPAAILTIMPIPAWTSCLQP